MTKSEVKKGKKIFYVRDVFSAVELGYIDDPKITSTILQTCTPNPSKLEFIKSVNWKNYVYDDGTMSDDWGSSGADLSKCFKTAKEALTFRKKWVEEYIADLKSEITDIKSLLEFPLKHQLCGEDYNDYAAEVYGNGLYVCGFGKLSPF